jgi:hypothetical protein
MHLRYDADLHTPWASPRPRERSPGEMTGAELRAALAQKRAALVMVLCVRAARGPLVTDPLWIETQLLALPVRVAQLAGARTE